VGYFPERTGGARLGSGRGICGEVAGVGVGTVSGGRDAVGAEEGGALPLLLLLVVITTAVVSVGARDGAGAGGMAWRLEASAAVDGAIGSGLVGGTEAAIDEEARGCTCRGENSAGLGVSMLGEIEYDEIEARLMAEFERLAPIGLVESGLEVGVDMKLVLGIELGRGLVEPLNRELAGSGELPFASVGFDAAATEVQASGAVLDDAESISSVGLMGVVAVGDVRGGKAASLVDAEGCRARCSVRSWLE